jgi:NAD(P)-dependent dehydrogenase (short-subunit alcohol dehydrogenase family)
VQLDGSVAVVTGAGAETGRAIALRLVAGGVLVVPDWVATDRAAGELERMTAVERNAAGPLVPMADVAAAVVAFIGDDELAGRVVLLRGGRPRRFLS